MAAFTDDFNRANGSPGANWTATASAAITFNRLVLNSTGGVGQWAICIGAALGAEQYGAVTIVTGVTLFPQLAIRYTDDTSPFYAVETRDSAATVNYWPNRSGGATPVSSVSGSMTITTGDRVGWSASGAGPVTIRVWKNPVGLPSSVSDWGGAPNITATDSSGTAVLSGPRVGLGAFGGQISFDNFAMGDFAAGGKASRHYYSAA